MVSWTIRISCSISISEHKATSHPVVQRLSNPHGLQHARRPWTPISKVCLLHCDASQPSHLPMPPSPAVLNLSQHRDFPMSLVISNDDQILEFQVWLIVSPVNIDCMISLVFDLALDSPCCPESPVFSPQFSKCYFSVLVSFTVQFLPTAYVTTENHSSTICLLIPFAFNILPRLFIAFPVKAARLLDCVVTIYSDLDIQERWKIRHYSISLFITSHFILTPCLSFLIF